VTSLGVKSSAKVGGEFCGRVAFMDPCIFRPTTARGYT
jgi:hypothetical protein